MPFFVNIAPPSVGELKSWLLNKGLLIDTPVPGFKGNAVAANIRKDGRIDMGLIVSDTPATMAGVFTQNKLVAAPVIVARRNLASGTGRAILVNSGCANAAFGQAGLDACLNTCQAAARVLGVEATQVFPCSTGVIGQGLPYERMNAKMPELVAGLSPDGLTLPAKAMMTTDAFAKMAQASLTLGGKKITLLGMAKGAGMIRPDMATMLSFVLTDAAVPAPDLQRMLMAAASASFNRTSVDGDTSTNDTLLVMASGAAGNAPLRAKEMDELQAAITLICQKLAAMLVMDGEGSEHLIVVRIKGAASRAQAYQACYAIAHSPLCKTAFYGRDPNWGRLCSTMGALAGRENFPYQQDKVSILMNEAKLVSQGQWLGAEAESAVASVMQESIYSLTLDLGLGEESFWIFTNDLGHTYVNINADYRS